MKRLLGVGVMVGLLVSGVSLSWAGTTVKSGKSNSSERVGKAADQGKVTKSSAVSATQDPCANVKNDPNQYAKCQDATKPVGLKNTLRRGGY